MLRDGYGLLIGGEYDTLEFTPTPQVKQVVFFFPLALEEGLFSNLNIWQISLKIDIFVLFFCLFLYNVAVKIGLPFIFSKSHYNCTDPGLQLEDPAQLKSLSLWMVLLIFYILVSFK